MSQADLEALLRRTDVLLFPSLWEGMSLSLIQAQARGIPVVTSDVVGNRDAVVHGVTGYVCDNDQDLLDATEALLTDESLRTRMGAAAAEHAREHLTDDTIGIDSLAIYGKLAARDQASGKLSYPSGGPPQTT